MSNVNNNAFDSDSNVSNVVLCDGECYVMSDPVVHMQASTVLSSFRSVVVDEPGTIVNGQTKTFVMPDDGLGPKICPVRFRGSVRRTNISGAPPHAVGVAGNIGGGGNGRARYTYAFPYPVDVVLYSGSINGIAEFCYIISNADEFLRGNGNVNRVSGQNYSNIQYHNGNFSGERIYYRETMGFTFDLQSGNSLSSGFSIQIVKSPVGLVPVQCRVPYEVAPVCGAGLHPETHLMTATKLAAPDWMTEKVLNAPSVDWEFSSDFGVTWGPAPATHTTALVAGQNRWRQTVTIPDGYKGHYRLAARGYLPGTAITGQYFYDGVFLNTQLIQIAAGSPYGNTSVYQDTSWYVDVVPGVHVFEFREPAATAVNPASMNLLADYRGVFAERRGFVRSGCYDNGTGLPVGPLTDLNYDGTPFVPRVGETQLLETY